MKRVLCSYWSIERARCSGSCVLTGQSSGQDEAGPMFLLVNRADKMKQVLCSYWSIELAGCLFIAGS